MLAAPYRMITGYHLTFPEILWHTPAMDTATATTKAAKPAKRGFWSRPALRSKRV